MKFVDVHNFRLRVRVLVDFASEMNAETEPNQRRSYRMTHLFQHLKLICGSLATIKNPEKQNKNENLC